MASIARSMCPSALFRRKSPARWSGWHAITLGLLLLSPAPRGLGQSASQDSVRLAEAYDRMSAAQYEIGTKLVALLRIAPGGSVLDLGCGTGQLASYVSRITGPTGKVLGLDPSPYRIAIAERRARKGLSFSVGGSGDLSALSSRSFDVVYLNYVLPWVDDREQALREIHRILKPGGKLGISFEDTSRPSELAELLEQSAKEVLGSLPPKLFLSTAPLGQEQLERRLRKRSFRILVVDKVESEDRARRPEDLLAFWRASSAGRFLSGVSEETSRRIGLRFQEHLAARTDQEIRILSETLLLVAERSGAD